MLAGGEAGTCVTNLQDIARLVTARAHLPPTGKHMHCMHEKTSTAQVSTQKKVMQMTDNA